MPDNTPNGSSIFQKILVAVVSLAAFVIAMQAGQFLRAWLLR